MTLELDSVSFSRSGRPEILSAVSIGISSGQIFAILGPNGAGKTTLLGLASGRLRPASGKVLLDGIPLETIGRPALARKIAVLPQFEKLAFNYSCLDFVLLGRAPHVHPLSMPGEADYFAARRALDGLGLSQHSGRPAGELSGGEFQLLRFARCLAQEAAILLLDEPTSMLDPANARQVADTLVRLAATGKAILFTTHDVALAGYLADEVALMGSGRNGEKGKRVERGDPREILTAEKLARAFGVDFGVQTVPGAFAESAGKSARGMDSP